MEDGSGQSRVGDKLRQLTIKAGFGSVAIHRSEHDFSRTTSGCLAPPLDGVPARRSASPRNEHFESAGTSVCTPGIDGHHDCLRAKTRRDCSNQLRVVHRGRVDRDLVRASLEHRCGIVEFTNSSADGEGNEQTACRAADDVEHRLAFAAGSGDVEQDDFVGAIAGVSGGTFHGVAGVAQIRELHAFHDPAAIHIETGEDALGQHLSNLIHWPQNSASQKFFSMSSPTVHDFSGWNCTAKIFPCSTTAENRAPYSVAAAVAATTGA